ncbi:MAG: glycosyltransferase family 4 protein, partial [Bacillota bacterium]
MKILIVASGNHNGKLGTVVQNQAKSLVKVGVSLDYFLIKKKGIKGYLEHIVMLFKQLKKQDYDIIHSHYSLSAFATTIVLWFSKKTPHIVSLMGSDIKASSLILHSINFCHRNFWDMTIVKSPSMANDLELNNLIILPNGVEVNKIIELEKGINSGGKLNHTSIQVLFAADPSRESKNFSLAKKAMKQIPGKLLVVYNKPHEEIIETILKTDVLLLTSRWEGSPNIIKEAMACNTPVVATDVGDIRWLFGNEPGHFICSFDPEDVAQKIEK